MPNEEAAILSTTNLQEDHGAALEICDEAQNKTKSTPSLDCNRNESKSLREFVPVTRSDVMACMEEDVKKLQRVLLLPFVVTRHLLNHFKWNEEKVLDRFYDCNQDELFKSAGLFIAANPEPATMCDICFDETFNGDEIVLRCGHKFCKLCFEQYLTSQVENNLQSSAIKCAGYACNWILEDELVYRHLKLAHQDRYGQMISNTYVKYSRYFRHCPAPDCKMVVYSYDESLKHISCQCGFEFCFVCSNEPHYPLPCKLMKSWKGLLVKPDDKFSKEWIEAFTKLCPKCKVRIVKDGGCDLMTCKQCNIRFCWACCHIYSELGLPHQRHYCNLYAPYNALTEHIQNEQNGNQAAPREDAEAASTSNSQTTSTENFQAAPRDDSEDSSTSNSQTTSTENFQAAPREDSEAASTSNSQTTSTENFQAAPREDSGAAAYHASRVSIIDYSTGNSRNARVENFRAAQTASSGNLERPAINMPSFLNADQLVSPNSRVPPQFKRRRVTPLIQNAYNTPMRTRLQRHREQHAENARYGFEHKFYYYQSRYNAVNQASANEKIRFAPLLLLKDDLMTKAVRSLAQCRAILMQGYIFAFYMTPGNNKLIFEQNFKNLGEATEKLAAMLVECAQDDPPSHAEIKEKLSFCQRRHTVLSDFLKEMCEGDNWQEV